MDSFDGIGYRSKHKAREANKQQGGVLARAVMLGRRVTGFPLEALKAGRGLSFGLTIIPANHGSPPHNYAER